MATINTIESTKQLEKALRIRIKNFEKVIENFSEKYYFSHIPNILERIVKEIGALEGSPDLHKKLLLLEKWLPNFAPLASEIIKKEEQKFKDKLHKISTTKYRTKEARLNQNEKLLKMQEVLVENHYKKDRRLFNTHLRYCISFIKTLQKDSKLLKLSKIDEKINPFKLAKQATYQLKKTKVNIKQQFHNFKMRSRSEKAMFLGGKFLQGLSLIADDSPMLSTGGLLSGQRLIDKANQKRAERKKWRAYELELKKAVALQKKSTIKSSKKQRKGDEIDNIKAAGGGSFITNGPANFTVGDNPGGKELVTVTPIGQAGNTSINGRNIKAAGGFAGVVKGAAAGWGKIKSAGTAVKGAWDAGKAATSSMKSAVSNSRIGKAYTGLQTFRDSLSAQDQTSDIQKAAPVDSSKALKVMLLGILMSTRQINSGINVANSRLNQIGMSVERLANNMANMNPADGETNVSNVLGSKEVATPEKKSRGLMGMVMDFLPTILTTLMSGTALATIGGIVMKGLMGAGTIGLVLATAYTSWKIGSWINKFLPENMIGDFIESGKAAFGIKTNDQKDAAQTARMNDAVARAKAVKEAIAANGGKPLTPDQLADVTKKYQGAYSKGGSFVAKKPGWISIAEHGPEAVSVNPVGRTGTAPAQSMDLAHAQQRVFEGKEPLKTVIVADESKVAKEQFKVAKEQQKSMIMAGSNPTAEEASEAIKKPGFFGKMKSFFGFGGESSSTGASAGYTGGGGYADGGGATGSYASVDSAPTPKGGISKNAQKAYDFFLKKGYSAEQAAGIVGNLIAESGPDLKTSAHGDIGQVIGGSHGIAQWNGARLSGLYKFAGTNEISRIPLEKQLEYVDYELTRGDKKQVGKALKEKTIVAESTGLINKRYEVSRDGMNNIHGKRIAYAEQVYNAQKGNINTSAVDKTASNAKNSSAEGVKVRAQLDANMIAGQKPIVIDKGATVVNNTQAAAPKIINVNSKDSQYMNFLYGKG